MTAHRSTSELIRANPAHQWQSRYLLELRESGVDLAARVRRLVAELVPDEGGNQKGHGMVHGGNQRILRGN
jgi:broad specificity phosphatase PhoE